MNPLKRGYDHNGAVVGPKDANKFIEMFEFACRKCLPCRLNSAREKSIRCWHESKFHEHNIFLTLTYSDDNLESPRLINQHWQKFQKDLRNHIFEEKLKKMYPHVKTHMERKALYKDIAKPFKKKIIEQIAIRTIVTGEYGELNKRPHWHAIIFNYAPDDSTFHRTSDRGDRLFKSATIDRIWGRNNSTIRPNEYGAVTLESAGYVARYAAKKLVHGRDQDHDYHPYHKTSSRRAIGRTWIEQNYKHTFENGFINLPAGVASIPRYYLDWCKKYQPDLFFNYVTKIRPAKEAWAKEIQRREEAEYLEYIENRRLTGSISEPEKRSYTRLSILKTKFKRLQERLKL